MTGYFVECPECGGKGTIYTIHGMPVEPCIRCSGRGFVQAPPINDAALRESLFRALHDAKLDGAISVDRACASTHRDCSPILQINYDKLIAAVRSILPPSLTTEDRAALGRVIGLARAFQDDSIVGTPWEQAIAAVTDDDLARLDRIAGGVAE